MIAARLKEITKSAPKDFDYRGGLTSRPVLLLRLQTRGYPDEDFDPQANATRYDSVVIFEPLFNQLKPYLQGLEKNISRGETSVAKVPSNDPISREEIAQMVENFFKVNFIPGALTGEWNGRSWGNIVFNGYEGTYTGTYNKKLGWIKLKKESDTSFSGTWGESDERFGSLTVGWEDDNQLTGTWQVDPKARKRATNSGRIRWTRKE